MSRLRRSIILTISDLGWNKTGLAPAPPENRAHLSSSADIWDLLGPTRYDQSFGACLLAALLCLQQTAAKNILLLTLAAASGIAIWVLLRTSTFAPRYILCSLTLFFIFFAGAAARASYFGSRLVKASVVVITSYAIFGSLCFLAPILSLSVSYARSGNIESYADDDAFVVARILNSTVPAGARVTLFSYYRYPLRADLLECAIGVEDITPEMPGNLKNYFINGSRYIVFDQSFRKSEMEQILGDVPPWLAMKQIYDGHRLAVFEMAALDGAPKASFQCKKYGSIWHRTAID